MRNKDALQETTVMKYYIIYLQIPANYHTATTIGNDYSTNRFIYIVEHEEVAKDFCKKNYGFYYEEVKIEK